MKKSLLLILFAFAWASTDLEAKPPFQEKPKAFPFSVSDMEGDMYKLDELRGKVVVLNFWFIQCKPCVMEMPELNKLAEKYQEEEVVFLAFARDGKEDLAKFLQKTAFGYKIIPDSHELSEKFGVFAYPTHVIIDKAGRISYNAVGLNPYTIIFLDEEIQALTE
jgi:thiol-disulfide isomerase/thioredoxin